MSLRAKMILGIGAILLLVIGVYAIITLRAQANYLTNDARHEAELVAALTERAIARAMTQGKSEEVQAILEQIGEVPHEARIRVVDPKGVVLWSSRPEERGWVLGRGDRFTGGVESVWDYRGRAVGVSRPIQNREACYACHPGEQATLGFLDVRLSFPSIASEIGRQSTVIILGAILALIATGALVAGYFTLVMGRRIDTIRESMSRVEAGDLTAVPEDSRDELGQLGRSFNAMVARLADAQRRLEDRHAEEIRRAEHLAALGKMAAGIAHEINNPLAGMQNCVRTLVKGVRDEAQRVQYLGMLQEGLGRVGRIIGQLLDFAREAKPQLTRTELAPLVHQCLDLLEHELAARHISRSVSLDADLPVLLADPRQLEQVLLNILMNAVEAMPNGGDLSVAARVRRREAALFVELSITDTGVGIPPENLPRIFDPFFTTKEVGKGTGLGLSVSYGIVRAHGGFVEVRSEIGKGSTFTVTLPASAGGKE